MRSRMQNVLTFSKIKQQDYCAFTSVFWIQPRYPEYISVFELGGGEGSGR